MLLQQQQKQHCLFMKHKTDKKTKNAKKKSIRLPNNHEKLYNKYL